MTTSAGRWRRGCRPGREKALSGSRPLTRSRRSSPSARPGADGAANDGGGARLSWGAGAAACTCAASGPTAGADASLAVGTTASSSAVRSQRRTVGPAMRNEARRVGDALLESSGKRGRIKVSCCCSCGPGGPPGGRRPDLHDAAVADAAGACHIPPRSNPETTCAEQAPKVSCRPRSRGSPRRP
jgi:hypothetical protein